MSFPICNYREQKAADEEQLFMLFMLEKDNSVKKLSVC